MCKQYLFFQIYDPLSIVYLVIILFFLSKCLWTFSAIHKNFTFGNHIGSFTSMTTYVFLVWPTHLLSLFMPINFEIVCTYVSKNTTVHEVLSWQPQIFYICKQYLYLHIYDPPCMPCLAVTCFLQNAWYFSAIHK